MPKYGQDDKKRLKNKSPYGVGANYYANGLNFRTLFACSGGKLAARMPGQSHRSVLHQ